MMLMRWSWKLVVLSGMSIHAVITDYTDDQESSD